MTIMQLSRSWFSDCNECKGTDKEVIDWTIEQLEFNINDDTCPRDEFEDCTEWIKFLKAARKLLKN